MKKERRTFSEWFKDIAGIEGDLKDTLKPAVGYTSGNIMLGGAGYPISMYHQQYLTYVEGLSTKQAGFISLIGGMWDAITDPIMGIISDHTRAKSGRHRRYLLIAVIPFMIAYIMKWTSFGISDTGNTRNIMLWYIAGTLLYSTAFTIASVPHTSMLPMVAPNYFQRTQFLFIEYLMNSVGQVTSFILTALILSEFDANAACGIDAALKHPFYQRARVADINLRRSSAFFRAVRIVKIGAAACDIRIFSQSGFQQHFQSIAVYPIITVNKKQILAVTSVYSGIACRGKASVCLADDGDP